MSTTAQEAPAPEPILLSQDQADNILAYAIEHRMYETGPEGLAAVDPQTRLNDAATLAFQAKRAAAAGNDSESVREVLFIAQVDMTAAAPAQPAEAPAVAAPPAPAAASPAAESDPYADSTDEQLEQALQAFRVVPASETIQAEIDRVEAVLAQRRQGAQATPAAQPAQEDAPVPAPAAPSAASGPVADDATGQQPPAAAPPAPAPAAPAPPVPAAGGPEPHTPPPPQDLPPVPGRQGSGVISAGGPPDASGAAAPPPAADAPADAGAQAAQPGTEGSVSAAQAPAQSGDPALLAQLTWATMEAYGLTIQTAQALSNDQLREIIANPDGPVAAAPPAASAAPAVAPEREALEAQVTGPMIKAWGRGRKQIPDLSDADLSTMVQYPGGPSTVPADASVQSPPQSAEEPASPQAAAAAASPPVAEPPPAASPAAPAATPPARPPSDPTQVSDAMAIIEREHFPIPPDIEDPYKLPNDVSKESDVELRSLHARAHAVECRVNWVISDRDDEVGDLERLLADRRRVVKLETPTTIDSKRLTKDQIEARIEADEQVIGFKSQIAVIQKGTGKLKVIRDNAHRDCERLSRQWSMRYKEENFSPAR